MYSSEGTPHTKTLSVALAPGESLGVPVHKDERFEVIVDLTKLADEYATALGEKSGEVSLLHGALVIRHERPRRRKAKPSFTWTEGEAVRLRHKASDPADEIEARKMDARAAEHATDAKSALGLYMTQALPNLSPVERRDLDRMIDDIILAAVNTTGAAMLRAKVARKAGK
jgi:hypothetical protein